MFCWMSAMCFDLGWTFARDRLRLPSSRGSDGLTFALYATFAGAVPAALLAWVVVDDMSGDGGDDGGLRTRPSVGAGSCFLSVAGLIKYFYIPVSVLLTFNAVAFRRHRPVTLEVQAVRKERGTGQEQLSPGGGKEKGRYKHN